MWADQVSSSDTASAHKKELVAGYSVEPEDEVTTKVEPDNMAEVQPTTDTQENATEETYANGDVPEAEVVPEPVYTDSPAPEEKTLPPPPPPPEPVPVPTEAKVSDITPEAETLAPVAFPSSDESAPVTFPSEDGPKETDAPSASAAPIAFPASEQSAPIAFPAPSDGSAPIAFPGSETASQSTPSVTERAQSPGVTFQNVATPPRVGTPDVDQEGKRRRTLSTQGIQRLARRISITSKRQGSTASAILANAIPGLKRADTSGSHDSHPRAEGSSTPREGAKGSPTASVNSDIPRTKTKKDKKDKREKRRSMM